MQADAYQNTKHLLFGQSCCSLQEAVVSEPVHLMLVTVLWMTSGSEWNCFASCSRKWLLKFCNMLNYRNEPWEDNMCGKHLMSQSWLFSLWKLVNELSCLGWLFHSPTLMYLVENGTVLYFKVILAVWWISLKSTAFDLEQQLFPIGTSVNNQSWPHWQAKASTDNFSLVSRYLYVDSFKNVLSLPSCHF